MAMWQVSKYDSSKHSNNRAIASTRVQLFIYLFLFLTQSDDSVQACINCLFVLFVTPHCLQYKITIYCDMRPIDVNFLCTSMASEFFDQNKCRVCDVHLSVCVCVRTSAETESFIRWVDPLKGDSIYVSRNMYLELRRWKNLISTWHRCEWRHCLLLVDLLTFSVTLYRSVNFI